MSSGGLNAANDPEAVETTIESLWGYAEQLLKALHRPCAGGGND
jgi:hypothetical protein